MTQTHETDLQTCGCARDAYEPHCTSVKWKKASITNRLLFWSLVGNWAGKHFMFFKKQGNKDRKLFAIGLKPHSIAIRLVTIVCFNWFVFLVIKVP